jgi:hypothetical protein
MVVFSRGHSSTRTPGTQTKGKVPFPQGFSNRVDDMNHQITATATDALLKRALLMTNESADVSQPSSDMRRQLRRIIESRLHEKHGSLEPQQLEKASKCIERLLFLEQQKNPKLSNYKDMSQLDDCLAALMKRLLQRKLAKVNPREEERRRVLVQSMGSEEIYEKANALVLEIKRLRLEHASVGCNSQSCRRARAQQGSCNLIPSCGAGIMPTPVARLFFNNIALVKAMEDLQMVKSKNGSPLPWATWMEQAADIVRDYKQWMMSNGGGTAREL